MDARELEITQSVLELAKKVIDDRAAERKADSMKHTLVFTVTICVIVVFGILWAYEIHESYNYNDMTIENKATATIERSEKYGEN